MKPGETIGRFAIDELVASTEMCELYKAVVVLENGFKQKVAVHLVRPNLTENRAFVQSFISDSLLAARLSHQNIMRVQELGRERNRYYVALEYVPGKLLRELLEQVRIRGEAVPVWFAFQVVAAICDGVQYAHEFRDERFQKLSVLHHDLTPDNVVVSFRGAVKIQNFCMARARTTAAAAVGEVAGQDLAYVAPERITGSGAVDSRSDIYSVGMLLLEMLTGVRPPADRELLRRFIAGQSSDKSAAGVPAQAQPLLRQALAEDPQDRFKSAKLLAQALRAYIEEQLVARDPVDVGDFVANRFPDDRGPTHTPTWGTPPVESVVDEVGAPDLVGAKEPVAFAFKREDGSTFRICGLEGWELDTGSSSDEDLFSERLSTQSMPVIQIKRLTEETQRTKD